ncbi:hypothetical protein ON010_g12509 [Phytophthora cinnamomi]|nr:hypothetical protein ON010_g12509 [Phytophthora cinnamomi]
METSGTTDPTQLVAAVQEKFGKMTRARLDSVVTVVDGDAVAQDALNGVEPCAVAICQLQCADVVLLNKVDLMDEERLQAARVVVKKYAPSARVYETDHGQVYLPHVLDIAPPEDVFNGGVSHENVQAQWNTGLSALNGSVTPAPSRLRVDRGKDVVVMEEVAQSQAFASVAYERAAPTSLAAMHDWIQHHLPKGTLRAKGVMYVAELPKYRFVVQLSGKRRLEVENAGLWQSTPKTQFVVIGFSSNSASNGEHFDEAQALESLEVCLSIGADDLENGSESARAASLAKLDDDERFETLAMTSGQATTVAFRLTCPTSTLDETMLRHHHHVDMNELTKRLVREVNASGGGSLLLYASNLSPNDVEGDQVYAVASIVGPASVLSMWSELDSRAELIITEVKKKLAGCLCGF